VVRVALATSTVTGMRRGDRSRYRRHRRSASEDAVGELRLDDLTLQCHVITRTVRR
jgi:hypothetical protein